MDRTALITAVSKAESVVIPDAKPAIRYIVQTRTEAGPLELVISPSAATDLVARLQVYVSADDGDDDA